MDVMSYTEVRNNLKTVMDRVVDDCSEVIITRRNGEPVVMMSLADYRSLQETEYLLATSANEERLLRGIREFEAGKGKIKNLAKP